jgi:uncharacterized protein YrrD
MQRTQTYSAPRERSASDASTWLSNGLATLLAALAVVSGVIGMLVAFSEVGDSAEPFRDGIMWLLGGVILAIAANVFRREHHIVSPGMAPSRGRGAMMPGARDVRDITGMVVVATREAREVGSVRDVLFDPKRRTVLGLIVAPAGARDSRMFVGRAHILGTGRHAVTIRSEADVQGFVTRDREREFTDAAVRLEGVRITTDQGDDVGKVGRVFVTPDLRIAALEAGGGVFGRRRRLAIADVISIGNGRVIVSGVRER